MATPSTTPTGTKTADTVNGLTQEQKERLLFHARVKGAAGRHKNNHDFIKSGQEQVAEYRRQLQKELDGLDAEKG